MNCPKCNTPLQGHEAFCPSCGVFISIEEPIKPSESPSAPAPDYVPSEIKKWNWGAFTFSIFWGIGNYNYLPLLCLIPFFNFIWIFVCGAKGNEWAWKSGKFNNVEDFLAVQETWSRAGFVSFIISLIAVGVFILFSVLPFMAMFF